MNKRFEEWSNLKQELQNNVDDIKFKQGDIYFMSVGQNIGYEQYGKGEYFLRPVLVYKKLSRSTFLGIPLTSKNKEGSYYFSFKYKKDVVSTAMLNQIRVFDIRRHKYYDGHINRKMFEKLKKKLNNFLNITPSKREDGHLGLQSDVSISQINLKQDYNILVTGSNGQLGSEIQELSSNYNYNFFFTNRDNLDISNESAIKEFVEKNSINVIINCGAYTAVDKAEEEKELATKINTKAVKKMAKMAKELSIKLIHISTDYVFDGKNFQPYLEEYQTNPVNFYGKTKLDGENEMIKINPYNSVIIRTSWVYSSYGYNFVKTMIRLAKDKDRNELGVIFDQIGTPTYAKDLAKVILDIIPNIENDKVQIYNYSNEGVLSWYDFAKEIMKMAKLDCQINPLETYQYPTPALRPHYSLLNKTKIKNDFDIEIPYWKDSLDRCLRKMGER